MPPQTGVTLQNMRSSSEDESLSKEILLHLSTIKPYLINSSINIPYSPPNYQKNHRSIFLASLKDTNFDVMCVGCGPLWRTSHCGRLGQVALLLSYVFGGIKSLRVHECKNAPFILLGAEKWATIFLHVSASSHFLVLQHKVLHKPKSSGNDDFGLGKTIC